MEKRAQILEKLLSSTYKPRLSAHSLSETSSETQTTKIKQENMANFFGGRDPFDHPFFTQPFGGFFGGRNSPFDDEFFARPFYSDYNNPRKQIKIEELNPNDDSGGNDISSKELPIEKSNDFPSGFHSVSFQRVAYGGPDGIYYTSSVGRRSGGDGVFLMEVKEEDRAVGESLHTISKGIRDKGHSVTEKKSCDGRVDSLQTLHNLEEDELGGFEENWRSNADKVLPGWNNGFNLLENNAAGFENTSLWNDFFEKWWHVPQQLEYNNYGYGDRTQPPPSPPPPSASRRIVPIE